METNKSVTPILWLRKSTDTVGQVKIRITENRKSTYVSLGFKIPAKLWNDNAKEVRKTDEVDYKDINTKIKEKVKELEAYEGQEGYQLKQDVKLSYINYFENEYIPRLVNPGTTIKYEMILKKVKAYRDSKSKKDILFSEIDTKLIADLNKFILKKCAVNTANHYLKLIKQVLDKAISESYYTYVRHPFLSFEFKNKKVKKSALEKTEIQKILKCHIEESDYLFDTRNKFLTQIFLQGMRVSDLQLLRWSNIVGDSIDYKMLKTGTDMTVYVNDLVWHIFIYQFKLLAAEENIKLPYIIELEAELKELESDRIRDLRLIGIANGFESVPATVGDAGIVEEIELSKKTILVNYKAAIRTIAKDKKYKDRFIFNFLKDEDFSNIKNNDFSKLTFEQYKTLKNKSIVYNRHLKDLQAKVGINTVLKSHLSRHSYAYMLLNSDVDLYTISQSLGHTGGLKVTEHYLKGLKNSKTADVNKAMADQYL